MANLTMDVNTSCSFQDLAGCEYSNYNSAYGDSRAIPAQLSTSCPPQAYYLRPECAPRFQLVSSLYGPGNFACWSLLLLSVCVSWILNPASRRKDSITNDFIMVLSMPVVAAAHFFHQIYQQHGDPDSHLPILQYLFTNRDGDNVRTVAAIEAPLTICEDFIVWGAFLYFLAAQRRQLRRMSLVLIVWMLCVSAELLLWSDWVAFPSSLLLRPFIFHMLPFAGVIVASGLLTTSLYLVELISGIMKWMNRTSKPEIESGISLQRHLFWPGRFSSWVSVFSALVGGFGVLWLKYAWIYPSFGYFTIRMMPMGDVSIRDLDQAVAALGGAVALVLSLVKAIKERKKAKMRVQ